MKKRNDIKCPLCGEMVEHHPPHMIQFHYTNPYLSCGCGFEFIIKIKKFVNSGQSMFEADKSNAITANNELIDKFTLKD